MLLGKRLYALLTFILVSILGGVLVAGLMVPAVGVAASTTKDALTGVNDLPVELEAPPQWQRSKLLTANGKVLAYFYDQNRIYVSLDKISADMKMAQVGIEDHRFY
ncbi:MAG TPA: penicillin-binding protein, partial [Propionibacteriaceae bacterium]|nr:penicillin-binding protein [Propionibacteriaceae bacterium]